ncbi:unnamed protein product [Orchesella dallaii]|uniref:Protein mesh n=1 Tax=Orchesella dallaii TaxID=48710 RepID=A0ABP1PM07_9HEXA
MKARVDPFNPERQWYQQSAANYILNSSRLNEIRSEMLYPFYDQGGGGYNIGDYQMRIRDNSPQITKHLGFRLPFFGFEYNYTWVSIHGFLAFSNGPKLSPTYPLTFPIVDYPKQPDPSFIGPFYSKCKIGELRGDELDPRRSGVYFRNERNLMQRTDQLGVELRERLKWDIREGIVGTEWFVPRHALIVTWKNVTFAGNTIEARKTTNTFQTVIATDEMRTYIIFNYKHIGWTSHTGAGGSSINGTGGTPAFIGFNAGNGTKSFEYKPYSQTPKIWNILSSGYVNGFPGRHIFRVDEKIMPGQCIPEIFDMASHKPMLTFAPESGNLLGGTIVNVTGPCFDRSQNITCRFNTLRVPGAVIDKNSATCVMPRIYATGYIDFYVEVDGSSDMQWKGKFFVETPSAAPELVTFPEGHELMKEPQKLLINWDYKNLTMNRKTAVSITLWGYREIMNNSEIVYLETLADETPNTGEYVVHPNDFYTRVKKMALNFEIGIVSVNITYPNDDLGIPYEPILWSRPIPLAWYLRPSWEKMYGQSWAENICENWISRDRLLNNFTSELPICPSMLKQAIADKGRFLPDQNCDMDSKVWNCYFQEYAKHCVRTAMPTGSGAGQQCCYDMHGYLMMTIDSKWGGRPNRVHEDGHIRWNETKVPSLSHYLYDIAPFLPCCAWSDRWSQGCMTFRLERRPSQNYVGYEPPAVATIFGDPHVYTFDGLFYTFNGRGEFVLVRSNTDRHKLDVQGRFEQIPDSLITGEVRATVLTAIAAKSNESVTVEVRMRPRDAQWRYKLDVIVDNRRVFFDRFPQKVQTFSGVTVYTPTAIQNQSHVIAMFESGAGIEVIENRGHMTARVYLPRTYLNQTRGLFGNWSGTMEDDLVLPDGSIANAASSKYLDYIHNQFAIHWMVDERQTDEKGYSLFYHENGKTSSSYNDRVFRPVMTNDIRQIIPYNVTLRAIDVEDYCGDSWPCKYDYAVTLNREYGRWAKNYQFQFVKLRDTELRKIVTCEPLMIPIHTRRSTFKYTSGTRVDFDCDPDFVFVGGRPLKCLATGKWAIMVYGKNEAEWLIWNPTMSPIRCIKPGEEPAVDESYQTLVIVVGVLLSILIFIIWIR